MHHALSHSKLSAESDIDIIKRIAETRDVPYENHIMKGLLYSTITWSMILGAVILGALIISHLIFNSALYLIYDISSLALFAYTVLFTIQLIKGILLSDSYNYEVSPHRIKTISKAFRLEKMQVEYGKMQDIILSVSLPQHIGDLATIYLDTSSNLVWHNNKKKKTFTPITETIPDLKLRDAKVLRNQIASYMGLNLKESKEHLAKKIPLEHIKPFKKTMPWAIIFTLLLILILLSPAANRIKITSILLYVSVLAVKYAYEIHYAHHYFYDVNEKFLTIKKGVFGFTETIIPFSRIEDIYIKEDPFDRLFGLRNVYISTIKNRDKPNTHIDGLSIKNADKIAEILLEKSIKKYAH